MSAKRRVVVCGRNYAKTSVFDATTYIANADTGYLTVFDDDEVVAIFSPGWESACYADAAEPAAQPA